MKKKPTWRMSDEELKREARKHAKWLRLVYKRNTRGAQLLGALACRLHRTW